MSSIYFKDIRNLNNYSIEYINYYFISRVCVQYVGCQDIYGCCGTFFEKIILPTIVLIYTS